MTTKGKTWASGKNARTTALTTPEVKKAFARLCNAEHTGVGPKLAAFMEREAAHFMKTTKEEI